MGRLEWNLREKADFQPVAAAAGEGYGAKGARASIIDTASPADELMKLLRAHDLAECAACASTRGTVAADRLHVSPVAVCCEGMAAQ